MQEARHNKDRSRRRFGGAMVAVALVAVWAGCSVEKHYDMLSFFFDGVPDPNAPRQGSAALFTDTSLPIFTVHEPFKGNACNTCHTDFADLSMLRGDASVCMTCHEGVTGEHPRMHGPVVAQVCLWCHNPHQSPYPYLLRDESPRVCQQCHQSVLLARAHRSDPTASERDCLGCHSGHGGSGPGFLLDQPAIQEAGPASPTPEPGE